MIGVFDSGIGGVTVMRDLIKVLPNEDYIYYSDTINNPYGDKTSEEIIKISDSIVSKLIKMGCKIIVIACNTASAISKDYLRSKYNIPIIAIEPAYKSVSNNEKTLVMATKATINSDKFKTLFNTYDNHNTILLSCSGLADLIEEGNKDKIIDYLKNKIGEYKDVKNVVLGCTHYPLIKDEITEVLGPVYFYDGSLGVSKHTKEVLEEKKLLSNNTGKITFIDSSNNNEKEILFYKLLRREHIMKLQSKYYDFILNGTKRIEIRLNDEKRQQIKIGDTIRFLKEPELNESFNAKVEDLLRYNSFEDMFKDYDISVLADKSMTKDELIGVLEQFYTKEKQEMYGVLGIKISLL